MFLPVNLLLGSCLITCKVLQIIIVITFTLKDEQSNGYYKVRNRQQQSKLWMKISSRKFLWAKFWMSEFPANMASWNVSRPTTSWSKRKTSPTTLVCLFVCLLVWFLIICVFIAKQFGLFLFWIGRIASVQKVWGWNRNTHVHQS